MSGAEILNSIPIRTNKICTHTSKPYEMIPYCKSQRSAFGSACESLLQSTIFQNMTFLEANLSNLFIPNVGLGLRGRSYQISSQLVKY